MLLFRSEIELMFLVFGLESIKKIFFSLGSEIEKNVLFTYVGLKIKFFVFMFGKVFCVFRSEIELTFRLKNL